MTRWLLAVIVVACGKHAPPADPLVDQFRTTERACRLAADDVFREEKVGLLYGWEVADALQKRAIRPCKDLQTRFEHVPVPDDNTELYAAMKHYLGERLAAWSDYASALFDDNDPDKRQKDYATSRQHAAAADREAAALDGLYQHAGLAALPAFVPDAGVVFDPPASGPPGAAWFLVGRNVVRLDDTGFSLVASDMSGLAVLPDGTAWACGFGNVVHWDGTRATSFASKLRSQLCTATPDGKLWDLEDHYYNHTPGTLGSFDGKTWTFTTTSQDNDSIEIQQIIADRDGQLYAMAGGQALVLDGQRWRALPLVGSVGWVSHLFTDAAGHAWIAYQHQKGRLAFAQLARGGGGEPIYIDPDQSTIPTMYAAIDRNGAATLLHVSHNRILQGTRELLLPAPVTRPGSSYTPGPFAYDAAGRLWLELEDGLSVIAHDGTRTVYPHGSLELFLQPIAQIAVIGAGPSKLPPPAAPVTRTITGIAVGEGDRPLANEPACLALRNFDNPCATPDSGRTTTTGPDGRFTFTDVPRWRYDIRVSGSRYSHNDCCVGNTDLGRMRVSP